MTSLICFLTVCTDPRAHHTVYTDPQHCNALRGLPHNEPSVEYKLWVPISISGESLVKYLHYASEAITL